MGQCVETPRQCVETPRQCVETLRWHVYSQQYCFTVASLSIHMASRSGTAVFEILAVFLVVYAIQFVTAFAGLVGLLFVLTPPVTESPWTAITSVYAHGGPSHLLSNAVALVLFGWPVARATTRVRFHLFFLATGSLAGISQILVSDWLTILPVVGTTPSVGVIGASGGVFALLGYLLASNRLSSSVAGSIDVPAGVSALVFVVVAAVLTWATASPGAALIAHFTGLLLGLLAGWVNLLADSHPQRDAQAAV